MMLPSSLLTSIFLLATSTYADDGLYHPSQYAGAAIATLTPTVQTTALDTTAETYSIPAAKNSNNPTTAAVAATGTDSWESQVTWPAGCESWANPCPSGAKISGGGVAGYTNGFTSYTTETNSYGVITGMPAVATVGAGVSVQANATTLSTITGSVRSFTGTTTSPSSTQSGFVVQSATSNGAGSLAIFSTSSLVMLVATFALFC